MGKKDFDNLNKVLKAALILAAGATQSQEVNFNLPRGYVAKVWQIEFSLLEIHEDLETVGFAANTFWGVNMGLWADPDDITSILLTEASTVQEGIVDHHISVSTEGPDGGAVIYGAEPKIITIPEHIDLMAFRNWRFNTVGVGTDLADLTEVNAIVIIRYTLEKVTDEMILNLLDIL